jgi:hypothetical protein
LPLLWKELSGKCVECSPIFVTLVFIEIVMDIVFYLYGHFATLFGGDIGQTKNKRSNLSDLLSG